MEYKYIVNPVTNRKCRVDSALGKKLIRMYKKALNGGGKRSREDDLSEMPSTKRHTVSTTHRQQPDIVGYTHSGFTSGWPGFEIWFSDNTPSPSLVITDKPVTNLSSFPIRLYYIDKNDKGDEIMYAYIENPQNPSKGMIYIFVKSERSKFSGDYDKDVELLFGETIFDRDSLDDDTDLKGVKYSELLYVEHNHEKWDIFIDDEDEEVHPFAILKDSDYCTGWSKNYYWLFNDSSKEWNLKRYIDTGEKPDQ